MGAFARALRTGTGRALAFLATPPQDDEAWRAYLETVRPAPLPRALGRALEDRQRVLEAGPKAEVNAQKLAAGEALAVVTGQQPGLLGGPLLTFHKVAGALHLARRLDALGGPSVVPVFWSATEDHDFAEANQAVVLDTAGQARVLKVEAEGDGRSIQDLDIPHAALSAVVDELAALLPATGRARAAAALAAPLPEDDFASWSARVLLRVFGDSGLVVLEPPLLAPSAGASLAFLLDNAETIRSGVNEAGRALREAKLPAPLDPLPPGATPLFYRVEPGGRRLRVSLDGDCVRLRDRPSGLTRADLREQLIADPARGSGNVVGRVFLQNRLLPVVAYVAGPSEIAYQAQVRSAHAALGLPFPFALPRPEATWTDSKVARDLAPHGRTVADILLDKREPRSASDPAAKGRLQAIDEALDALAQEHVPGMEPGRGRDALARELIRLRTTWEKASRKVMAAFEEDAGVGRARWERAMSWLRPRGRPQDRNLSPLALIARHGLDEVRAGLQCLDPLAPVHHVLRLGEDPPAA